MRSKSSQKTMTDFFAAVSIKPAQVLLLSGFYCYAYIFFNRLFFSPSESTALHPTLIQVVLAISALFIMLFPRLVPQKNANSRTFFITGVLFVAGVVVGFAGISDSLFSGFTARLLGIGLFGTGFVLYTILWARTYERLKPSTALLAITFSVFLSTIIRNFTYADIYGNIIVGGIFIIVMCLSLSLLYKAQSLPQDLWAINTERILPDQSLKDVFLGETKEPLFATFAIAFGIGLVWGENSSFNYNSLFSIVAVSVVTATVCYLAISRSSSPYFYYVLYRIAFPLAGLLLLSSLFLISPGISFITEQIFQFAYYLAIAFFEVAVIASLVTTAHLNDFSSTRAIAAKFFVYGTGFLLGKLLLLTFGQTVVNTALGVALITYIAISIIILAKNLLSAPREPFETIQEKISRDAFVRYGLTPRELDILNGLLQGRTYEGIARMLFISSSTVKTHVKHIYTKAGVATRDELIDLLTRQHGV